MNDDYATHIENGCGYEDRKCECSCGYLGSLGLTPCSACETCPSEDEEFWEERMKDEEYGRIRDTELDYMVVYPYLWADAARVLDEVTGVSLLLNAQTNLQGLPPAFLAVYNRYLENRPKPWQEAKKNEVWDLEVTGEGTLRALVTEEHPGGRATFLIANLASIFGYTYSLTTNGEITGGKRVLEA